MSDVCEGYEKAALLCLLPSTRMSPSDISSADQQILWLVSGAEACEVYSHCESHIRGWSEKLNVE